MSLKPSPKSSIGKLRRRSLRIESLERRQVMTVGVAPLVGYAGDLDVVEGGILDLAVENFDPAEVIATVAWDVDGDLDFDDGVTGISTSANWSQLGLADATAGGTFFSSVSVRVTDTEGDFVQFPIELVAFNAAPTIDSVSFTGGGDACGGGGGPVTLIVEATEHSLTDGMAVFAQIPTGEGTTDEIMELVGDHYELVLPAGVTTVSVYAIDTEDAVSPTSGPHAVPTGGGSGSPVIESANGVLTIVGTCESDWVLVSNITGGYRVYASWLSETTLYQDVAGAGVTTILAQLKGGDDVFTTASDVVLSAVIVGGDGNDLLTGTRGRSILIGGEGTDVLLGGRGEDLLIGGWTSFDTDADALLAILAEWTSPTSLDSRITNLLGADETEGANGDYILALGETVFDDDDLDLLVGGLATDWIVPGEGDLVLSFFDRIGIEIDDVL